VQASYRLLCMRLTLLGYSICCAYRYVYPVLQFMKSIIREELRQHPRHTGARSLTDSYIVQSCGIEDLVVHTLDVSVTVAHINHTYARTGEA
jgi:hypothetical protein